MAIFDLLLAPINRAYAALRDLVGAQILTPWFICFLLVGLAGYLIFTQGLTTKFSAAKISEGDASGWVNLWFSSKGELIALQQKNKIITVWKWSDNGQLERKKQSFDLDRLNDYINDQIRSAQPPNPSSKPAEPIWAVARDGSVIAFYWKGYLLIAAPTDADGIPQTVRLETTNPNDVISALAFTDNDLLALLYPTGKIELLDSTNYSRVVGVNKTNLRVNNNLWTFYDYLAVVSYEDTAVVVFDLNRFNSGPKPKGYPVSGIKGFSLAVSPNGRLAVNPGSSTIFVSQNETGDADIELNAPGPVRALAFYDEEKILCGLEGGAIYMVSQGDSPAFVTDSTLSVHLVATKAGQMAYATETGVILMSVLAARDLNSKGRIIIVSLFVILLPWAVGSLIQRRRESRRRAALEAARKDKGATRLELPTVPTALIEACVAGECVLYVGAGLSAQAGFPTWDEFVESLLKWAVDNQVIEEDFAQSLRASLDAEQYDPVADSIVHEVRSSNKLKLLNDYLRKVFLQRKPLPETHHLLRNIKFSALLTTNFDSLLEENYRERNAPVYIPNDTEQLLGALTKGDFFILKLYGTLDDADSVLVAPAQYEEAITGNRDFSQFMETLFRSRKLLFIGSSLEGIEAYLKGITLPKGTLLTHFALVAVTDNAWAAKADLLKRRYGIDVLPYTPSEGFPEVEEFIASLSKEVNRRAVAPTTDRSLARLKKVKLKNIGPFPELELELDKEWNILLGDNGVGKSSIIKAIAVALCGEKALPFAKRLIRVGNTHGSITLETEHTRYETELRLNPKTDYGVDILSATVRPLEAEGWLAVGFPPLRTTTWERSKGPEAEPKVKLRPTADDLLPLVRGGLDPRLDSLKQWIVNLDYWGLGTRQSARGADYEGPIAKLFSILNRLTKGSEIDFEKIDRDSREIILKTSDGPIPIEMVSQGMSSLIGWIGILVQRLYEIYEADHDPTQRYALVLMDEIDAHMHPAWQQALVQRLKQEFPNAQFIATTHSPLIVGGMPAEQLFRFTREKEGNIVRLEVEADMTMGRTDQVLTGDLFSLDTTLDVVTQGKIGRYKELLESPSRDEKDERELQELRKALEFRIPPTGETAPERQAQTLLHSLLKLQAGDKYPEMQEQVMLEAERLFKTLRTRQANKQ